MNIGDLGRAPRAFIFALSTTVAFAAGLAPTRAAVVISTAATQNMNCSAGVCTPTAKKAVLNVGDLANLLAAGDAKVVSDSKAVDIRFAAPLSWTSSSRLTLDSYRSILFQQPVSVAGTGALTITTNDGGSGGDFSFEKKGHVEFWDSRSKLVIDGGSYALVNSVQQLARAIAGNPSGSYALAKSYNAGNDGAYGQSPVSTTFTGTFEGLGNRVLHLAIADTTPNSNVGFFAYADDSSVLRDFGLEDVTVSGGSATAGNTESVGALAGVTRGSVIRCYATAQSVVAGDGAFVGGLAGFNGGGITGAWAQGSVSGRKQSAVGGLVGKSQVTSFITLSHADETVDGGGGYYAGGLIGDNRDSGVTQSFATGSVGGASIYNGGVAGSDEGGIADSYAMSSVHGGAGTYDGGLTGSTNGIVQRSYSTGRVRAKNATYAGGFTGGTISSVRINDYWDLDTSGFSDPGQGCGDTPGCSGVTGLTTKEFRSALPFGFDASVWGLNPNINNGYPYLLANPPPK